MRGYTTREVAEVLGVPVSRILSWTRSGLLSPERGTRGGYRYSFQDIVLLRAARELLEQRVTLRRVRAALEALREQLPEGRPLSAVRITAVGDRVVVHDAGATWEPTSGQLTLDFPVSEVAARAEPVARRGLDRPGVPTDPTPEDWYHTGLDLEAVSPEEAAEAYGRAIALDPRHAQAHLNLGRLLHERGQPEEALRHYADALGEDPGDARAQYNLGVAFEDLGRPDEAARAYRLALTLDDTLAAAHFNLFRLLEAAGGGSEAIAHLAAYKRLKEGTRG
jgi:tetratricopeptide (TPR) repeat protein